MWLVKPLVRLVDLPRLRGRQLRLQSRRRMLGIVGTTRVQEQLLRRRLDVVVRRWRRMQPVWVRPRLHLVARLVRLVRRLDGKHCEEVRARQMQPRQRVWLQVRLWWHLEDRRRRRLLPLVLLHRRLVGDLRRWPRLLVRRVAQRCCLVEAARRRRRVWQVRQCAWQADQRQLRLRQQVPPWSEVVDRRCRQATRRLRQLGLEVQVHQRPRRRQAERLGRLWLLTVAQCLSRLVQLVLRRRVQEHL